MIEAIYLEVSEKTETAKSEKRQVSVYGMLKYLGVSQSGYLAWLSRVPSDTQKHREIQSESIVIVIICHQTTLKLYQETQKGDLFFLS